MMFYVCAKDMAGLSKAESGNHALGRPCHFSVTILILPDPLAGCDFCDEGDHQQKTVLEPTGFAMSPAIIDKYL